MPQILADGITTLFGDEDLPGDQFPEATAARLIIAVTPQYHAAVACLAEPGTALGAVVLMRPLIEAWAHLYFIVGKDDLADAACRALRLEVGLAVEILGMVQDAGQAYANQVESAQRRVEELEATAGSLGCKGNRRSYSEVGSTVKAMGKERNIPWLFGAWRSFSLTGHVGGWDWSIEDQGDGRSAIVDSSPSLRAGWLKNIVVLYSNVVWAYMLVTGIPYDSVAEAPFGSAVNGVLNDRWLERMIDGDFD
jgi:hypothetical protein